MSPKVTKNMESIKKETILSTINGPPVLKESVYLVISTIGTESSINAKEYDYFFNSELIRSLEMCH